MTHPSRTRHRAERPRRKAKRVVPSGGGAKGSFISTRCGMGGGARGRVFVDRYHAAQLRTPRQVRAARAYVLNNRRRHLRKLGKPQPTATWVDPFSSAVRNGSVLKSRGPPPGVAPRTWLARVGWKRHGLVSVREVPGH